MENKPKVPLDTITGTETEIRAKAKLAFEQGYETFISQVGDKWELELSKPPKGEKPSIRGELIRRKKVRKPRRITLVERVVTTELTEVLPGAGIFVAPGKTVIID